MISTVEGLLPWKYRDEVEEVTDEGETVSVWRGLPLVDAGAYFAGWGADFGADLVADLEAGDEMVSLCSGAFPWLKDLNRAAWDSAFFVEEQAIGNIVVIDGEDLQDFVGLDEEEGVAFVNVVGNVTVISNYCDAAGACTGSLAVDLTSFCGADLTEVWWESMESVVNAAGWSIVGDEGDGCRGSLVHESIRCCEKCGRWGIDGEVIGDSDLCAECAEEDSWADLSRGVRS